ncbi:MAG: 3'-5' exoribonuclease YhaM family protein [Pseudobdellovibrionaceae bacterium]
MDKQNISDLKDKESVDSFFLLQEKQMSLGKNGRPFLVLLLGDKTGVIDARVWDRVEEVNSELEVGSIVSVKGQVQLFQNRKQIIIHKIGRNENNQLKIEDFIPQSNIDTEALFAQLLVIVNGVQNPSLQQLLKNTINDVEIKSLLLRAPAAKTIHHAWIGGLLEHIVSICKLMNFIGEHYSFLNKDLLIFGAIFHDIGKIWELSFEKGFAYTDRGRLLGHMQLACELIDKKAAQILGFPADLKDICKHIILSHHGKMEYGSPKTPQFLEALVVAMVDDFDSKISTVKTLIEQDRTTGVGWSRYSEMFDRYFMLDDLKEKFK